MATAEATPGLSINVVNLILYGQGERQRFTQDTPILPEVWQVFAGRPTIRHDLLLTPLDSCSAISLMRTLRAALPRDVWVDAELAPLQSFLAVKLTFRELIRHVLPLTKWAVTARTKFEKKGKLPFDPDSAFQQIYDAAQGIPPRKPEKGRDGSEHPLIRGQLFEIARILTVIAAINISEDEALPEIVDVKDLVPLREKIVARITVLLERLAAMETPEGLIWRVASNRRLSQATLQSRATIKADAAFRLFDVHCGSITWAVVDSGIDAKHEAFKRKDPQPGETASRVVATYELGLLRGLLNAAYERAPKDNPALKEAAAASGLSAKDALVYLEKAYQSYSTEILDWSSIEPLVRAADPATPEDGHGTHVAGIIGADWEAGDVRGMCPDIQLMDFRILGRDLEDTEFAVIGALQLVRYLNSHNRYIVVHGVNLSLSIPHVVESYACGRTPVCEECDRLVGAGVTVVAAAGNEGYHKFNTHRGPFNGYSVASITDPGNADAVITVGATHKHEPHAYGVSYFSSRGPTGDGRTKPDLVAPGERIVSCLPDGEAGVLDGTSQAAPHVSAAAAMLMARYPELNRDPQRIKQILCDSATDLGRERAFQGHGLLDVLRALQSF